MTYPDNNLSPITVTTAAEFVSANINSILASLNQTNIFSFTQYYDAISKIQNKNSTAFTTPNAYILRHYEMPSFASLMGGGAGVAQLIEAGTGVPSGPSIANAIIETFNRLQGAEVPLATLTALTVTTIDIAVKGGLIAGKALGGYLGNAGWSSAESNIAFGLSNAQIVASVIQSDTFRNQIIAAVKNTNPGADAATLDKITQTAIGAVSQELVKLSLTEASQNLNTNVPGTPITSLPTIQQVLNSSSNQSRLEAKLLSTLEARSNLDATQSQNFVNDLLAILSQQQITGNADLYTAFQNAVVQAEQEANVQLSPQIQAALIAQAANLILLQSIIFSITSQALNAANQATLAFIENISATNEKRTEEAKEDQKKEDIIKEDIAKQEDAYDIAHPSPLYSLAASFQNYADNQNPPTAPQNVVIPPQAAPVTNVNRTPSEITTGAAPVIAANITPTTAPPVAAPPETQSQRVTRRVVADLYNPGKVLLYAFSISLAGAPGEVTGLPGQSGKGKASVDILV